MERQTTPSIAGQTSLHKPPFSSKGKVPNRNKYNRSIKPNKFHSKYVCFGSRKTLFVFPEMLVVRSVTTAARKVVSSWSLTGPFKSEHECEQALKFARVLQFKWTDQSWRWNHLVSGRCHRPDHKCLRKAEEANFKANLSFFTSHLTAEAHLFGVKFIGL